MSEETKIACEKCKGKGEIAVDGFFNRSGVCSGFEIDVPMKCFDCLGKGYRTPESLKQQRVGEYFKRSRVEDGITMREAAKILGWTMTDISRFQHGQYGFDE